MHFQNTVLSPWSQYRCHSLLFAHSACELVYSSHQSSQKTATTDKRIHLRATNRIFFFLFLYLSEFSKTYCQCTNNQHVTLLNKCKTNVEVQIHSYTTYLVIVSCCFYSSIKYFFLFFFVIWNIVRHRNAGEHL